jgi:fatty-acyl-CoA synthase
LRADHPADGADSEQAREVDLSGWKMIIGGSAMTGSLARMARDRD